MNKELLNKTLENINKGVSISPFLFVGNNLDIVNKKAYDFALEISEKLEIPKSYIYTLKDISEKIKVKDLKDFTSKKDSIPPFRVQIFIIENISNFTIASSNSMLKFFEEPGIYNIIITTNSWENNVMETILSRVQTINIQTTSIKNNNGFYKKLIEDYIKWNNLDLIKYTFSKKIEKQEYIEIIESLILYLKENIVYINFLEEINQELNLIKKNNLNAKYIFEKWIIKLKK